MMRFMSFLLGLGLGRRQHGSEEFITIVDHDTPFGLGFVPIEADYIYMALLHKERLRARLLHMPFDYLVHPYRMSLANYFCLVRQLQLSDGAPSTSTSILVTPPSPDCTSLLMLYFPEETDEYETFIEITDIIDEAILHDEYNDEMLMVDMSKITDDVQLKTASPLNLLGILAIEMVKDVQLVPAPGLLTVVAHDDDIFEGVTSPVVVEFEHVDPLLSFDVLLRFVSCSNDMMRLYNMIQMKTLLFASDSSPSDQRVSPTTRDAEIVDFGTTDQSKELRIGLDLSTDERDSLTQLLRSYFDVFAWSYEDMSGLNPSIVQHHLQFYLMSDRLS
ncbi:hypothetical protein CK203_109670 [Vitis vinifera]|uniref:Uncharacterized protein n=1 Tax=Vitis vinifera TaxID=29760 RepID=A0A438CF75_VITVI|nr:hypothetical protein CK203_109670 [Vitis vinifera]